MANQDRLKELIADAKECGEFVKPYPLADAKSKKRRVLGGLLDKIKHETSLTVFISRVDWWGSKDVQAYLAAVEENGGIYAHRWGDAPIQTTALKLFAPSSWGQLQAIRGGLTTGTWCMHAKVAGSRHEIWPG
mmetsp:Transcript_68777/g.188737  ORF Transcript_68777/g.188737 Transcript_68777/m.188737 type:complete len:133 (+) Transcript_68777:1255-1653(+)